MHNFQKNQFFTKFFSKANALWGYSPPFCISVEESETPGHIPFQIAIYSPAGTEQNTPATQAHRFSDAYWVTQIHGLQGGPKENKYIKTAPQKCSIRHVHRNTISCTQSHRPPHNILSCTAWHTTPVLNKPSDRISVPADAPSQTKTSPKEKNRT